MKYRPLKSKWSLSGLILIVALISIFILSRIGMLSRISRLAAVSQSTTPTPETAELYLTPERPVLLLPDHIAAVRIEPPEEGIKNPVLSVCDEVILSEKYNGNPTTDWFYLAGKKDSLILTGAINCAVWEFLDANDRLTVITDEHTFSDMKSVDSSNQSYSSCRIPRGAVKARVTFRNENQPYEAQDSDILIYYGKILQGYTDQSVTLALPELSKNQSIVWEDGEWTLREGYKVIRQLELSDPGFSTGKILKMEGDAGGSVIVTYYKEEYEKESEEKYEGVIPLEGRESEVTQKGQENEPAQEGNEPGLTQERNETEPAQKAGESSLAQEGNEAGLTQKELRGISAEYGIRHSLDSGISVCERLGDAQGAHFDFMVEDEWQGDGVNDFDRFYPWSDMRLCDVFPNDGMHEIIYEDDPRFSLDGSSGNVMVEIPKFYVKRNIADGYEEVWISGVCHEGYEIEPVFVSDGKELEHVYISAYLGSVSSKEVSIAQSATVFETAANDIGTKEHSSTDSDPATTVSTASPRLVSVSGSFPEIRIPYAELLEMAENNGEGFSEINFLMYQAIQKLFLVETGSLDCSSLIAGHAKGYFYHPAEDGDTSKTCLALESATQTNTVKVTNRSSWKIAIGNSVILLDQKKGWDAYDDGGTARCREVIRIQKDRDKGITTLTLDGEPFDVVEGETVVSGYPTRTGRMDKLSYSTSVYHSNNGKHAFKYRGIENIYGTSLLLLDSDAFIKGSDFYYYDGNGKLQKISEPVPVQNTTLNASEKGFTQGNVNCIRRMSFDINHPTVMVPIECGASSYNYYADYWLYRPKSNEAHYYLAVGGAYDNDRLCGIFQMRGLFASKNFKGNFHLGRIMYREPVPEAEIEQ